MPRTKTIGDDLAPEQRTSPNQLRKLQSCARLWWYENIAGMKAAPGAASVAAMNSGAAVHRSIEKFLLGESEDLDDLSRLAAPLLAQLREQEGLMVEEQIYYERAGVLVRGYVDVLTPRGVIDIKTMKSWRYALQADDLRQDLQLMTYALWAFEYWQDLEVFSVAQLQLCASLNAWRFVADRVTRAEVFAWAEQRLDPLLLLQQRIAMEQHALSVPGTDAHCGAFGGCPYRALCHDDAAQLEAFRLFFG